MADGTERAVFGYRARLTKGEEIRYVSHLDYASIVRRAVLRAKLPAAYSGGFNPHMRMSFASALAVGVTSDAEYMDFDLSERVDAAEVKRRLGAALPSGARLTDLAAADGKLPPLMAAVDEAVYETSGPLNGMEEAARRAADAFNGAAECVFHRVTPKRTREIDIKKYVKGPVRLATDAPGRFTLTFSVLVTPEGSVKPGELVSLLCGRFALPADERSVLTHRKALLCGGRTPLELLNG